MDQVYDLRSDNLYELAPEYMEYYRLCPLDWYVERLGGKITDFKWTEFGGPYDGEHVWDGMIDPLATIFQYISEGKWLSVEAATSVGKTYIMAIIAIWFLDVYRGGTVTIIGNSYTDIMDTVWAEIYPRKEQILKLLPNAKFYDSGRIICDKNDEKSSKWKLIMKGMQSRRGHQSSGSGQGRHADYMLYLIDEGAKVDASVYTALDNTSSERRDNIVAAFGNPDSMGDPLHQFGNLPYVHRIRISALDHPNVVFRKKMIPGGAVSWDSIVERRMGREPDDPFLLSRIQGISPADSQHSLIKFSMLERARNFQPEYFGPDTNHVGIDVANSEKGDFGSFMHMDGPIVMTGKDFRCPNANAIVTNMLYKGIDLEEKLKYYVDKNGELKVRLNPLPNYELNFNIDDVGLHEYEIGVDATGVGVGTVNEFVNEDMAIYSFVAGGTVMKNEGLVQLVPVKPGTNIPLYRFEDVRSLAFWLLADDLAHGRIGFHKDFPEPLFRRLQLELSCYYLEPSKYGWKLASKDKIKDKMVDGKSPNNGDSLIICNFMRHLAINGLLFSADYDPGAHSFKSGYDYPL